jgi:putative transposase
MKEICLELEKRHELHFLEIGIDKDHVHFLIQTIPNISPSKLTNTIKGNLSRELFLHHPELKMVLWGGNLWTEGFYINTVGNANLKTLENYVKNQGLPEYKQLHMSNQKTLF